MDYKFNPGLFGQSLKRLFEGAYDESLDDANLYEKTIADYSEREGLEGPFQSRTGFIYYYDPKEGKYYDPSTDFYLGNDELESRGITEGETKQLHEINQEVLQKFIDQYGEEKGKQIYYATANKQERSPETFEKLEEDEHEDENPEVEEQELTAISDMTDAAKDVSELSQKLETIEDLEHDGVVPEDTHDQIEGEISPELDDAIEKLKTAHESFKDAEVKEGNPAFTNEIETSPEESDDETIEEPTEIESDEEDDDSELE